MGTLGSSCAKKGNYEGQARSEFRVNATCLEVMLWYNKPYERLMLKDEDAPFKEYEKPPARKKVRYSSLMSVYNI